VESENKPIRRWESKTRLPLFGDALVDKLTESPALRQHSDHGDGISINPYIGGFQVFAHIHLLVMAAQIPSVAEAYK
jgi:hypothetical protein